MELMKVFSPCITITFTNFTDVFSEEGKELLLRTHTSEEGSWNSVTHLQTCSGREGSDHLHQLYMSSQRKGKDCFSLFTFEDGFWNNPSAQVEREKDPITSTNFTDVFSEAGRDCFSLFISEDGS
jgi:hypothetical protein